MDLLALADFILVARHGGFGQAARAARRPKATLSRRVAALERGLGLRLFERGTKTPRLTDEGIALFERAAPLFTELEETVASVTAKSAKPRGRLRVSLPLLFAQTHGGTLAARFALRFPEVRLDVTAEDRKVDLVEEGYDVAIRVNPAPDDALVGRVFIRDQLVVAARPELARPNAGSAAPGVEWGQAGPRSAWTIVTSTGVATIDVEPVLRVSSLIMARDAIRAGIGAGCLPRSLISDDLAAGTLVHWGDVDGPEITLWALHSSRRLQSARVSAFLEFLTDMFAKPTHEAHAPERP